MISTKGRYALRVMIDLAEHYGDAFVPLKDVAERQQISKKYLEIIARELVSAKLITGVSGKGGGYKLVRDPAEYSVGEIIEAMEGTLSPVACLACEVNDCPRAENCKTLPMWTEFSTIVHNFFYDRKLDSFV